MDIVLYLAAAKLLLHLAAASNYGYFVDELYFIACGEHLDWGYVDHAPLIAAYVKISRLLLGDSLLALRFLPALAGAVKVVLTGLIARELGARRFAQGLAALAVVLAPMYLGIDHLMTMNAFEAVYWMGCIYVLIRVLKTGDHRLLLWFGVLAGLGLENKHSMLFFGFAVFVALLLTPKRKLLLNRWIWIAGTLAFLIFLPNLIWQIRHGFPTIELLRNVQRSGRNVPLNPLGFMLEQILVMHPLTFPIWAAGLWYCFRRPEWRVLGWIYVVILAEFLVMKGRVYYLVPIYPMLFAAGAIAVDEFLERRRTWWRPAYITALVVSGAVLAPFALPVLPVETYLAYSKVLHFEPPKLETHRMGPLPQIYADMFGWEEMVDVVAQAWFRLPEDVRSKTAIFGNNYGQAGAVDFFGPKHGLPKAVSGHQNYYYWGPRDYTGESILVLGDSRQSLEKVCSSVEAVGEVTHKYSMPYEHFTLFHCRGLKQPLKDLWPKLKNWG